LPKVSQDDLKAFGLAVKRERSLRGWGLDRLGAEVDPPVGKSFISKIENGRKETLNSLTVGRFIKALDLDENWIDRFLGTDTTDDGGETTAERDADRIIERAQREDVTEGASEELLIQLANNYAEGAHKDRETAYIAVRTALVSYASMRATGAIKGNADAQFHAIMAEVAELNNQGALDEADALLDQEDRRMRETHKAERDRLDQQAAILLAQRLDQDRLRNRPDLAAKRLIKNLMQTPQAGGLFLAIDTKANDWNNLGDDIGDIFALHTALELAKANYERVRKKSALAPSALYTLGWCHFRLAERSSNDRHLVVARNVFETALKKTSKSKNPQSWAIYQSGLGNTLVQMGEREGDIDLLQRALKCHRAALEIDIKNKSNTPSSRWNDLGISLLELGKITHDPASLGEAVTALETALALEDRRANKVTWGVTQNNLALAQSWLGDVTDDLAILTRARQGYAACEALEFREEAPFIWAMLQWNIADLALARHRLAPDPVLLTEARDHVTAARGFFVDGSDYQTQRCDDLLDQINQAEA